MGSEQDVESLGVLQLFRMNLAKKKKETGLLVIDPVRGEVNFKQYQMMEYYDNDSPQNVQYNVMFSQSFGKDLDYQDEENFLGNQYLLVQ